MSSELLAISPLDGRYKREVKDLANYFSEFALIKERIYVETRYLVFISKLIGKNLDQSIADRLSDLYKDFDLKKASEVKRLEARFDHDVKAVEVYLAGLVGDLAPYIHFGLTSEDTNNLAYGRLIKRFLKEAYSPVLKEVVLRLAALAEKYADSPMLARTHGQPASPTTFGKEMGLYAYRVAEAFRRLVDVRIKGKLNGAVGNLNALAAAYPSVDWMKAASEFVESLDLEPELFTTQILPYDSYVEVFNVVALINSILIGLCRDIWSYYSYGYISLGFDRGTVGSSTMPHKVNPKDFENAEGNLKIANALFHLYMSELPVNRLQRDLTDSTIRRSFGVAFGHTILAYRRLARGLRNVRFEEEKAKRDLLKHGEVFSEALQVLLRKEGVRDAYFKVLERVKGKRQTIKEIMKLASSFGLPQNTLAKFEKIVKENYVGLAPKLARLMVKKTISLLNEAQTNIENPKPVNA